MGAELNQQVSIVLPDSSTISGFLVTPSAPRACYVLAHGAGAGMTHPFMTSIANGLAQRGIATLRYQFPYMEQRSKRPDPPRIAHTAVRAAVGEAARLLPDVPLFAGGKSFGGRMTSQAQALAPMEGLRGLVFLGFPLHPAGKPSDERAKHLFDVRIPMLFLQGTRDELADLKLLQPLFEKLTQSNNIVTLKLFEAADHSFHVPARTGRKDANVQNELLDVFADWIDRSLATSH
jgi:predicted alpha/beta-hydrolase family hydrolase